ncbi:MAG: hypothetical protein UHK60_07650 [Acutalibacteraceae bacterium]|nr:hypothetical protein [Acutalibacteraceae bacterium]
MKKYIKPEAELIKYSLNDVIAASGDPEDGFPDVNAGGDGDGDGFFDGDGF